MARITPPQPTPAQLAADPAFDATFVPKAGAALDLPLSGFVANAGAPVVTFMASFFVLGMAFDKGADEQAVGNFRAPSWATTVTVDLLHSNAAATAGNVRWSASIVTTNPTAFVDTTAATVAAPLDTAVTTTTLNAAVAIDATKQLALAVSRVGLHAGDTLDNDALLVGVRLRFG